MPSWLHKFRPSGFGTLYLRRISKDIKRIADLYEADCRSRGVVVIDTSIHEEVEVSYGSTSPDADGREDLFSGY